MSRKNAYTFFKFIIENDTGMIYGDTGSGKSQIVTAIIREAAVLGKKVAICDTEGNYSGNVRSWLQKNTKYDYTTNFDNVLKWAQALPKKLDLVVLDSLGAPVLGAFALANMKSRGDMLLRSEALAYLLKTYAQENEAMCLITNQPVSEMNKARDMKGALLEKLEPFGGKTNFFLKEVLWSEKQSGKDTLISEFSLTVHKSRHMPTGYVLATMRLSNANITITFSPYSGMKGSDLPPITVITQGENGNDSEKDKLKPPKKKPPKEDLPKAEESEMPIEEESEEKDDPPVKIDDLRESLKSLMSAGGVTDELFTALAFSADLAGMQSPDDLKSVDSLNVMIDLVTEHIEKHKGGEAKPAGLFDE